MFNLFLMDYGLKEEYLQIKIPIYILYFLIFPLLVITFISIFRESRKMFIYLNISLFFMIIFHAIFFVVRYQKAIDPTRFLLSYIFFNLLFVIVPTVLINYWKHLPVDNEIESIGTHND